MKRFLSATLILPLLAGCGIEKEDEYETFTFTAEDAAEISAHLDDLFEEQAEVGDDLTREPVVLDVTSMYRFDDLRSSVGSLEENTFRVTNVFLNVREEPNVRSKKVEELSKGDRLALLDYPNASWAHVKLPDGRTGYVSNSYIALVTTEGQLPAVKKDYEGQYSVDFQFLNVRSTPDTQGQKLGELNANQIIRPLAFHDDWARIEFDGQEGFVSSQYLRPFSPSIVVRQETFALPVLLYRGDEPGIGEALVQHLAVLKSAGKRIMTFREFYELLLEQEERDVRLPLDSVLLAVTDLTSETVREAADALRASGENATFFISSADITPGAIGSDVIASLIANGNDVQSAGHSGEDLRAMTNDQVLRELSQSKQIIEELTQADVFAIAYPEGGVNDRIAGKAIESGYLFGVTLMPSGEARFARSQFLRLPAHSITAETDGEAVRGMVGVE